MNINVVWKWTKWGVVLGLALMVWGLRTQIQTEQAKQQQLASELRQAVSANQSNMNTIEVLRAQANQSNALLVQRQQQAQMTQRQLNEEMATLKTALENVQCIIPAAVTERLRQPY